MKNSMHRFGGLLTSAALLLTCMFSAGAHAALVSLDAIVTMNGGGGFHYEYSITNDSSLDLSIVSIGVPALISAISSAVTPAGFHTNFDAQLGQLDFVEGSSSFTPGTTISGFNFDSPFAPAAGVFSAAALNANGELVEYTGSTQTPQVPEPSTLTLAAVSSLCLLLFAARRRRTTR